LLQLLRDGQPLNVTRRKSRALLYYLAAHTQRFALHLRREAQRSKRSSRLEALVGRAKP
jgi:hypothetical protein